MDLVKVSVWVVGVAGLVAGMAPRTGPRDPGQSNVGLQAVRVRRSPTPSSQVSPTTAAHLARRTALPRRRGLRRGGKNTRQSTLSLNRVPAPVEKATKSGRRAVLRILKVRRKRPPTKAAPQFLNERELVEPQKSLVFQATTPASASLPNIRVHQHSTVGIVPSPTPSPAPQQPSSPSPPRPTPQPVFAPTPKPASNFPQTPNFLPPAPKPRQNSATEPSATPAPDFHHFPTPAVRFRPVEQEDRLKSPRKEVQVQSIFKPLRAKPTSSSFLPTAKPSRPNRPRQGSGRQGGRRRLRFRPSKATSAGSQPQNTKQAPINQPVTEAFQVLDAVPQQQEGVRSRPGGDSQSFSSESSFEEGLRSQQSSGVSQGGSRPKPGDFQTIFGEFRPGQTFAQSAGRNRGSSIDPQSTRIPQQTINQRQRVGQNQNQPQRFGQPQGFGQPQRFEPAQVFEQPRTTSQPQRLEQPRTTAVPQRFNQPRTSVQPQRFGQPRTSVQPQRFDQPGKNRFQNFAQIPQRSQRPASTQRFTPQQQNSPGLQRFKEREQNNLNQFVDNKLNLASSSNPATNLQQNQFRPASVPQQAARPGSFQQDAIESFFSGSTFPPSFPAMEVPRSGLQSDQRFIGHPATNFNMVDGSYSIFTIL